MPRKRTEMLRIRLTPDEMQLLKNVADKMGLSVSEYVREMAITPAPSILKDNKSKKFISVTGTSVGTFGYLMDEQSSLIKK